MKDDIDYLTRPVESLPKIAAQRLKMLHAIDIYTIYDLISYFPRTYVQFPEIKRPDEVVEGETAAVIGQIRQTPVVKRVRSMQITVTSIAGMGKRLELVWFRLPYIKNSLFSRHFMYAFVQSLPQRAARRLPFVFKEVPRAMAQAFRDGNLGVMDFYRLQNIDSDTSMRKSIAGDEKEKHT